MGKPAVLLLHLLILSGRQPRAFDLIRLMAQEQQLPFPFRLIGYRSRVLLLGLAVIPVHCGKLLLFIT